MENILTPLQANFIKQYPEFKEFLNNDANIDIVNALINKIKCLFIEYKCVNDDGSSNCNITLPFYMLLAHYILLGGYAKDYGMEASEGIIASSSIDSVSVSFQSTPYNNSDFKYQLSLTPYGREYLLYLSVNRGIRYIN